ncbi:hypothetical protein JW887_01945 [Candidatus Dojkabacteria bacterium]|nr:hypothetical protein [Candidatus Dojkabacteria bacterium]
MSKLLKKLLSAALFPAALLIVAKILGLYLSTRIFDLDWVLRSHTSEFFSIELIYTDSNAALITNSYSNLIMVSTILIGVTILLFQAYFLHDSHQNPKVLIKLIQFDFIMWLVDSKTLYPKLAVWLSFLWLSTIVSIVQTIQSTTYIGIAVFAIVASIFTTWLAARDFEREIHLYIPSAKDLKL